MNIPQPKYGLLQLLSLIGLLQELRSCKSGLLHAPEQFQALHAGE
jgi:hypothetical protein